MKEKGRDLVNARGRVKDLANVRKLLLFFIIPVSLCFADAQYG